MMFQFSRLHCYGARTSGRSPWLAASRVCLRWTALASFLAPDCFRRSHGLGLEDCTGAPRTPPSKVEPSLRRASHKSTVNATYGAPEPTHGSPAIMVRMSVRHCVEIFSRGDGVRPELQSLAAAAKGGKTRAAAGPSRPITPSLHHSCTAGCRSDRGSVAGAP